jgi:hypothetical protein
MRPRLGVKIPPRSHSPRAFSNRGYAQDASNLFLFSLLFKRSTRFLCIFSSISAKRSRSSFAARLVLIASTRRYNLSERRISHQSFSRTCRSASFSSFISLILALVASKAFRSAARFSNEDWFARGRNAFLLSCHCFPVRHRD